MIETAVGVDNAGAWIAGRHGSPAIMLPFACESQMNAEVNLRRADPPCRGLAKPGAWDHGRTCRNQSARNQFKEGRDRGLAHAYVIRVDDRDPVGGCEAEFAKDRILFHPADSLA